MRIVLDTDLKTPTDSILMKSAYALRLWLFHSYDTGCEADYIAGGAVLHKSAQHDLSDVLRQLAEKGVTRVLVEGGATIHSAFIKDGLWDELLVYRAPTLLGENTKTVVKGLDLDTLAQRYDFQRAGCQLIGTDMLECYKPKEK